MDINWSVVNKHLKCPKCGEPARITPGTDGYEAEHTHRFPLSRATTQAISDKYRKPTYEELEKEIQNLKKTLDTK